MQRETSKAAEFGKAVHEKRYVLAVKQRTAPFPQLWLQTGVISEC
jgi:hypothetical protein